MKLFVWALLSLVGFAIISIIFRYGNSIGVRLAIVGSHENVWVKKCSVYFCASSNTLL